MVTSSNLRSVFHIKSEKKDLIEWKKIIYLKLFYLNKQFIKIK